MVFRVVSLEQVVVLLWVRLNSVCEMEQLFVLNRELF